MKGPFDHTIFYMGLSSDTKPTVGILIGSEFFETDTSLWFIFDGTSWNKKIIAEGGLVREFVEATSGALSGGTGTITLGIASGSRILSIQLRVDTAVTASGGGTTWTAAYVNTPTTAICSGQLFAKNTVYSAIHAAYEKATGTVSITLTPNAGAFTAGVIRAVVLYEAMENLGTI